MDDKVGVKIELEGEIAIVAFEAAVMSDTEEVTAASQQIEGFIEENRPGAIVVDFQQVKFFSSQVLGLLLAIRAKLKNYDGEVVISAIDPQLYRVFKITNLDKIFRFFPDKDTAVEALSNN